MWEVEAPPAAAAWSKYSCSSEGSCVMGTRSAGAGTRGREQGTGGDHTVGWWRWRLRLRLPLGHYYLFLLLRGKLLHGHPRCRGRGSCSCFSCSDQPAARQNNNPWPGDCRRERGAAAAAAAVAGGASRPAAAPRRSPTGALVGLGPPSIDVFGMPSLASLCRLHWQPGFASPMATTLH